MMTTRTMLGAETEYFFAVLLKNGKRGDPGRYLRKVIEFAMKLYPALRDAASGGCFLSNGARLYLDCGHPEYSSAECTSPREVLRSILAGDRIMQSIAEAIKTEDRDVAEVVLCRCHVDYSGSGVTWGAHESYLHRSASAALPRQLLSHLASRVIYCGAGGLGSLSSQIDFQIEPRTPHIKNLTAGTSTRDRPLFHTKNETLASGGYNRLHLLASATACSQKATLLRLGTTSLIAALVDLHKDPAQSIQLADPLQAMRTFSGDVECESCVRTVDGKTITAIGIQRVYLEEVQSELDKGNLPEWASEITELWATVLDELDRDPMRLVGVLDWPTKFTLFKDFCERNGVPWPAPNRQNQRVQSGNAAPQRIRHQLCELDVRFSQLDEKGIFESLDRDDQLNHKLIPDADIAHSLTEPPNQGRAKLRGKWVKELAGVEGASCDWQGVFDPNSNRRLDLSDPFEEEVRWTELATRPQPRPSNIRTGTSRQAAALRSRLARTRNLTE